MRRRKIGHADADSLKKKSYVDMPCSSCGELVEVDNETASVLCSSCVQRRVPVEAKLLIQKSATPATDDSVKPRGWRFMKEFVDKDGVVYHSGTEVPELKGTLTPTDVVSIKAKQKEKSKERKANKANRELKKEAKLLKEFEKKKKLKEKEEKRREKEEKKKEKEAKKLKKLGESE